MSWEEHLRKLESIRWEFTKFKASFMTDKNFAALINHLRNPHHTSVLGYTVIADRDMPTTNIDISGYFSEGIVDILCRFATPRCKIRLLSPPLNLKYAQDRRNLTALRRMQDAGVEIRINERNHSRLLITYMTEEETVGPTALIVGSFDFNREGLSGERRDAGIITRHPELIRSALEFFNEIWETPYETQTLDTKYPSRKT